MKKSSENQLFFDFDTPAEIPVVEAEKVDLLNNSADGKPVANASETAESAVNTAATVAVEVESAPVSEQILYQAVLAQLVKHGATGAALHVPCRRYKYKAAVAAYFSSCERRFNQVENSVLVDIYSRRNQCIPECAGSQAVALELAELRKQRTAMEEVIKLEEPELRVEDELFDEFRSFDFARSSNKAYHKLCRRIASLQHSLYKGTRMEQLARSAVADYLIIAVPEKMISVDELPDGWGLWYIAADRQIQEVKAPVKQSCTAESRLHLVQNIGRCALNNVLFANGVKLQHDGKMRFTRLPRARRK